MAIKMEFIILSFTKPNISHTRCDELNAEATNR